MWMNSEIQLKGKCVNRRILLPTRYWDVNELLKQIGSNSKALFLIHKMKTTRANTFIAISSIALLILLIIQVNWIVRSARMKEVLFNEKANMVLAKASEVLASDQAACGSIKESLDKSEAGGGTP